jgi:septal ring factor EnvC (AmiA/AmiB activator)
LFTGGIATAETNSTEDKYKREQLKKVKKQIQESEQAIENQKVKHKFLTNLLKNSEQDIAKVARQLNQIKNDKKANTLQVSELKTEQQQLDSEKVQNKKLLAGQISSMYVTGKHDHTKLLLNQQQPGKLERILGYYDFLNRARTKNLDRITNIMARLEEIDQQLAQTLSSLDTLEKEQLEKRDQLNRHQKDRRKTIAKIQLRLKTESQQLEQLKSNQQALTKALEKLASMVTKAIELVGLSHLKGELGWPVNGSLHNKFGRQRRGSLRWKGVTIASQTGTPVKTVHQGLVLFADWLKGFGWVIVVDHGEGYMSLYGHNQTLLKAVGEKVEAGEPIALVGKSGGQTNSGLYFELRHQGIAINPAFWCKVGV